MHVLHTSPETGGFAVQAVLEETGAEYRLAEVDTKAGQHRSPDFLKRNPMGQVPVLELPDGTVMTETAAMLIHLADRLAPGRLAPEPDSPARPAYLRWLMFMAVNLYQADLRAYYPERYTADGTGATGVKAAAVRDMDRQLAILDQLIGDRPYLLGDSFTAADPYLLMLAHWHPEAKSAFSRFGNVARVCDKVRMRKAVTAANQYHRIW
jgi:glutathione S-transferase